MGDAWNNSWSCDDKIRRVGSVKLRVDRSGGEGNGGVSGTGTGLFGGSRLVRGVRCGRRRADT